MKEKISIQKVINNMFIIQAFKMMKMNKLCIYDNLDMYPINFPIFQIQLIYDIYDFKYIIFKLGKTVCFCPYTTVLRKNRIRETIFPIYGHFFTRI